MHEFDLFTPAFRANPYPVYAAMRESDPVHGVTMPGGVKMWLITRYDDVVAVLKDGRFIKNAASILTAEEIGELAQAEQNEDNRYLRYLSENLLNLDPPQHTRLRALVHKLFTPALMEMLREHVQSVADSLLDAINGVNQTGQFDLIADYAFPLPIIVLCELLGIPPEDRATFRGWADVIISENVSRAGLAHRVTVVKALIAYMRECIAARRLDPGPDLISGFIQAENGGDCLNEDELYAMICQMIIAGHDTVVNLIGNGTLALLQHPGEMARLRADPALIKTGVEEMLRYDGPVETSTLRLAGEDIEYGGKRISKADMVLVVIAAADRDPAHFPNPDTFDITRQDNKHIAFGQGIHYCLGAALARVEGQIAINTLLRRMPGLRLAISPDQLRWRSSLLLRGVEALPVAF